MTSGYGFAVSAFPQVSNPVPAGTSCLQPPSFLDSLGRLTCTVTPKTGSDLRVQESGLVKWVMKTQWKYDDGGRKAAGFKGSTDDCVTRAIAIVTGLEYRTVYDELHSRMKARKGLHGRHRSPRNGVSATVYKPLLREIGFEWTPTMHIGSGCTTHLADVPEGRHIVRLSGHLTALVDGEIRDTFDPRRISVPIINGVSNGDLARDTRCVYGYWTWSDSPGGES